jgi:hypothetical protein
MHIRFWVAHRFQRCDRVPTMNAGHGESVGDEGAKKDVRFI